MTCICSPNIVDLYLDWCAHRRSWIYYSESVRLADDKTFDSVQCDSWANFTSNSCYKTDDQVEAFMGIDADPTLRGNYYLQTNAEEPFSRDEQGIIYEQL